MSGPPPRGEAPADDLDGLIRRADPDRWLSSRFIGGPGARADVIALYAFDHELRRAPQAASRALLAEIRLTWWREVLEQIAAGAPVRRHPTAEALAAAVRRRGLPVGRLEAAVDARLYALDGDRAQGEVEAAQHITAAAARALDPEADEAAAGRIGSAWAAGRIDDEARAAARLISPAAFPAVAHAALADRPGGDLSRRLRLTWAVARGRI